MRYYKLLQSNTENIPQLELSPYMITGAAKGLVDPNFDEIRSIPSTINKKGIAEKSNQSLGFQPQTQSTFLTLYPNVNKQTTEKISPTEVTGTSIPTSSPPIPEFKIPQQVPTKTVRSNSDFFREPNTSEKFTSQYISSGVTSHQFHIQVTASLLFFQIKRTKRI